MFTDLWIKDMTSDLSKLGTETRALSDYELVLKNKPTRKEIVNTTNWRIQAPMSGNLKHAIICLR